MGFKSSIGDPYVWLHADLKTDGEKYYEYILFYVENILAISHKAIVIMDEIRTTFKFMDNKVAPPETYLGARLQKIYIKGKSCWTMSSVDYVNAAVTNAEEKLKKEGKSLPLKSVTPMNSTIAV